MEKEAARRKLARIDGLLACMETPLSERQMARIAEIRKDAEAEDDPELRDVLFGFKSKVQQFNRLRGRKLNTLLKGVSGQSLMQMKVKDVLSLLYHLPDSI